MLKYVHARAIKRPTFDGVFIPGHFVSDAGAVYEVHDSADDPQPAHPYRIGQRAFAAMQRDPNRIVVTEAKAEDFDERLPDMSDADRLQRLEATVREQQDQIAQLLRHIEETDAPAKTRRG